MSLKSNMFSVSPSHTYKVRMRHDYFDRDNDPIIKEDVIVHYEDKYIEIKPEVIQSDSASGHPRQIVSFEVRIVLEKTLVLNWGQANRKPTKLNRQIQRAMKKNESIETSEGFIEASSWQSQAKEIVFQDQWCEFYVQEKLGYDAVYLMKAVALEEIKGEYLALKLYQFVKKMLFTHPKDVIKKHFPKTIEDDAERRMRARLRIGQVYRLKDGKEVLLLDQFCWPTKVFTEEGEHGDINFDELLFENGQPVEGDSDFGEVASLLLTSEYENDRNRGRHLLEFVEKNRKRKQRRAKSLRKKVKELDDND